MKKIKTTIILLIICSLTFSQTQIGSDFIGVNEESLGYSIALSIDGSILCISSIGHSEIGRFQGRIETYKNENGSWVQLTKPIIGDIGEGLGSTIVLSTDGTIMAVGSEFATDDPTGEDLTFTGTVKVYENKSGNWIQVGQTLKGENERDQLGGRISLSADGSVLAVGAVLDDTNGEDAGSLKIYKNVNNNWNQIGAFYGETPRAHLGVTSALSSDGKILAISDSNSGIDIGKVIIYKYEGDSNWIKIEEIFGESDFDAFGLGLSLTPDGSTIAIGAPIQEVNGLGYAGYVRVYKNINGSWTKIGQDILGTQLFGTTGDVVSLSNDGSILSVASNGFNTPSSTDEFDYGHGKVTIYEYQNNNWVQIGSDIFGDNAGDNFGRSMFLSGDGKTVAVGSDFANSDFANIGDNGIARVFDLKQIVLSTDAPSLASQFKLYPNPTSNILNIELKKGIVINKINLYNNLGQLINTTETTNNLNVSHISKGVYTLEIVTDENGKASKKIVIN